MLDPVGSTSWHNRHLESFRRLNDLLAASSPQIHRIMVVGPGAVTRLLAPLLNDSALPHRRRWRKLIGDIARYGDQILRRLPLMPLCSLEPLELRAALVVPHHLVIVDRSKRVLAAAARDLPRTECHRVDLDRGPLPSQADVVVAFNVICRLPHPAAGMAAVAEAVRPGGWLLVDDRSAIHLCDRCDFRPVGSKIHQRRAEPA